MSFLIALTFCTPIICEEYIVDGGLTSHLTRSECIVRLKEERSFVMSQSVEQAYSWYREAFKAERMKGKVGSWEINCYADNVVSN